MNLTESYNELYTASKAYNETIVRRGTGAETIFQS